MDANDANIYLTDEFTMWRWFKRPNILSVFLWLLLNANTEKGNDFFLNVERGSIITNNAVIAEECGLTIQNVRTALMNLEHTGEIRRERKNHYQIITVTDYEKYASTPK